MDKTVVEKIAQEQGRGAWTPFINTDQGDLLLFVFLPAGVLGGFVMGFYWRKIFTPLEATEQQEKRKMPLTGFIEKDGLKNAQGSIQ